MGTAISRRRPPSTPGETPAAEGPCPPGTREPGTPGARPGPAPARVEIRPSVDRPQRPGGRRRSPRGTLTAGNAASPRCQAQCPRRSRSGRRPTDHSAPAGGPGDGDGARRGLRLPRRPPRPARREEPRRPQTRASDPPGDDQGREPAAASRKRARPGDVTASRRRADAAPPAPRTGTTPPPAGQPRGLARRHDRPAPEGFRRPPATVAPRRPPTHTHTATTRQSGQNHLSRPLHLRPDWMPHAPDLPLRTSSPCRYIPVLTNPSPSTGATGPYGEVVLRRRGELSEIIANGCFLMDTSDGRSERLLIDAALRRPHRPARRAPRPHRRPRRRLLPRARRRRPPLGPYHRRRARAGDHRLAPRRDRWRRSPARLSPTPAPRSCTRISSTYVNEPLRPHTTRSVSTSTTAPTGPSPRTTRASTRRPDWPPAQGPLKPGGVLAVWSAQPSPDFEGALRNAGFSGVRTEEIPVARGVPDVVHLAVRPA